MPSLMPGTPGAKEAYGLSIINEDHTIKIPPDALKRYGIKEGGAVLLISVRAGEGGFGLITRRKAETTVFAKYLEQLNESGEVARAGDKAYVLTEYADGRLKLNEEILGAFNLPAGQMLISVKSTTTTLGFTPRETWAKKLRKHGFNEAAENIEKLPVF